jgi:predicted N-acetyltransferase YhbS
MSMDYAEAATPDVAETAALFRDTFTASEGAEEGALIGGLVERLLTTTRAGDLHVFTARDGGRLAGGILFTRLVYDGEARRVFLLAPVAVATDRQGQGVGQALIRHGLAAMRAKGADVALTYGDPAYYGRVGFRPITVEEVAAPYALSQPVGWLGQALDGNAPLRLAGTCTPVPAWADPAFW